MAGAVDRAAEVAGDVGGVVCKGDLSGKYFSMIVDMAVVTTTSAVRNRKTTPIPYTIKFNPWLSNESSISITLNKYPHTHEKTPALIASITMPEADDWNLSTVGFAHQTVLVAPANTASVAKTSGRHRHNGQTRTQPPQRRP